jgi:hypothetical protein
MAGSRPATRHCSIIIKRSTNFDSVALKHVIGPLFIEILGHVHSQGALGIVLARPGGDGVGRPGGGIGAGWYWAATRFWR